MMSPTHDAQNPPSIPIGKTKKQKNDPGGDTIHTYITHIL